MQHSDFVHLHNHSDYSLLDGASPIPGMVARAAELRMPALALTDHGSLFGAIEFYQEARKAGVKPIVGMEAYVTRGKRQDRTRDTAHHLVLLARDETGFRNLMRLSSLAFLEGFYYKPRVDHEILSRYSEGLLALSACPKGEIATDLLADDEAGAVRTAHMYRDLFGAENYFLEMQNHGLEIEDQIRARVEALARKTGIPLVATNDCHYLKHEDADAHDVLLCIQTGKTVDDRDRMRYQTDQVFFKSADEMKAVFANHPEALKNTIAIAERCNLQMSFGKPLLPAFPLPPGVESAETYLRDLSWEGVRKRYGDIAETVRERLEYELGVICRMGFAPYFLIVRDFIDFARKKGIGVGPGRGSVAGSLVAFSLRITDIDPLKHGLIFERFLNPERVSMPDIDIDFDDLRRGEVIEYVKDKYGDDNVTQIITFGTMGAKGVIRDVGRALGIAYTDVDRIAKMVPDGLGMTLDRALELSPDLKSLPQRGDAFGRLLRSARTLEGLARHASTHAAGVLITPGPLLDFVPLYRQKDESVTTQWDMKAVEKAGLLKMDFLGLRTLSVLAETVRLVEKHRGTKVDLDTLGLEDADAYRVFQTADTVAIFQFESNGMRDYLKRLKPTVFEDLVAMNALYRPGPMENIPYFIDCKHGRQVVRYDHPDLEPLLKGTYGVFVYQEQVMAAANVLAGFSMAQADELRRAMGKKIASEMESKRKQFIEGCKEKKIAPAKAEKIFATMEKFAGYGFNKCVGRNTVLVDATTGEKRTVGELNEDGGKFMVHALTDDMKLVPRRVVDIVSNGEKPTFKLRTRLGHVIEATGNHPFRTLSGWTWLEELEPGDRIAVARRLQVKGDTIWPEHEVIALAGLLSEGNTCHPTTLYFYGNDRTLVTDFAQAIGKFPDTVARIYARADHRLEVAANLGRDYRARDRGLVREGFADLIDGDLALDAAMLPRRSGAFLWAEQLGLLGKKATEKFVPPEVFRLSDRQIELFLGRLWSGDGYVAGRGTGNNVPHYATSSEALAKDVQTLLLRIGIVSGIHAKQFKYRGGSRQGFTVHLLGDGSVETFLSRVAPNLVGRDETISILRQYVSSKTFSRSTRDTIPPQVRQWVNEERRETGLPWTELEARSGVSMKEFTGRGSERKRGFRRGTMGRLAEFFSSKRLADLATSDVFWDTVVSIEPSGVQETYDLTVEGDHNFVADGILVHNSHSAAYALVAYQCAHLKAHYPAEFMAATLTSEMSDSARIVTLIEESRRMGLEVLPPDVNRSEWKFTLEDGKIRFGLGAVRNVGQGPVESLVAARQDGGTFRDLFDLARRLDARAMNRRVLESLVSSGACDALGRERGALFAAAGTMLEHAAALQRQKESGQSSLFGDGGEGGVAVVAPALPQCEPWANRERSAREKEVLGFYFSEHPLEEYREELARLTTHTIAQALELGDGAEVRVAGIVGEVKPITTRAGKPMAIVTIEDLTGRIEGTVFPDAFQQARPLLTTEQVLIASARIELREDRGTRLLFSELRGLDDARRTFRRCLHIEIRAKELTEDWLAEVDEVLSAHPGDSEVYLHIVRPDHSRLALRSRRFRVAEDDRLPAVLREKQPGLRVYWGKGPS